MSPLFIDRRPAILPDGSRRAVVVSTYIGYSVRAKGALDAAESVTSALLAGRRKRELAETAAMRETT